MKYNPKLTATDEYYFSKFIRNMAARKYSESSLRSYTTHLKAIKESLNKRNLSLSDLSPAVMEEVTEDWKEVAKNTHNMRVTTISNLFEYLKSIEKADKNPVSSHNYLRVEKYQKQPPTDKEVEKIVKETRKYSPEIEFGIALMTYAGLRVSELENIVFSSLTDNENYTSLMIHAKKYEKTRIVIIYNEYARNLIKRQLEINKLLDCSIVFPSRNYFNMILRKIGEKHGFSYSCHDLRRYYATSLAKKGVPVPLIAKVLGHESIATTQRYLFINYADVFSFFDTFGAN